MSEAASSMPDENPFCSRRIRPGGAPYLFPAEWSAARIVERLRETGCWGEIIGPHGSGKSSLLATIMPQMEDAGQATLLIELHDGQRRLPINLRRACRLEPPGVIVVDGYEQLSGWSRFQLKRFCRSRRLGLLITTHQSMGLPLLFATAPSLALAEQVVEQLLDAKLSLQSLTLVHACYARHDGNMREMLFDLFDLYRQGALPAAKDDLDLR